jgi:heme-degrading monooxygenase HmoA
MFARMTIMQVKTEMIDEAIALFKQSVIPDAKKQKGFKGSCLLVDRNLGRGIAVTFWRNEKDAIASEENRYYQEQLVKALNFFTLPPIREGYEVSLHSIEKPAKKIAKKRKR